MNRVLNKVEQFDRFVCGLLPRLKHWFDWWKQQKLAKHLYRCGAWLISLGLKFDNPELVQRFEATPTAHITIRSIRKHRPLV